MYYLMNKDSVLSEFWFDEEGTNFERLVSVNSGTSVAIFNWIKMRSAANHRKEIKRLLKEIGCNTISDFCKVTKCLSLTDSLWVKTDVDRMSWRDINLYHNEFNKELAVAAICNGTYVGSEESLTSPEWTTDGQFGKCWIRKGNNVVLLKCGTIDSDIPPYSEVLASQVFLELDKRSVEYTMNFEHNKPASSCELFTTEDVGYMPYAILVQQGISTSEFGAIMSEYDRFGYYDMFAAMIVGDAITLNVDRHLGNFGWYMLNDTMERRTMAPIFDFNLCYVPFLKEICDMDRNLSNLSPRIGGDWVAAAKRVMTGNLRAKLINLKDLYLTIQCDDNFSEDRLRRINIIKNVMIDRILGREAEFKF